LQELLKRLQDRHVECAQAVVKKDAADVTSAATVNPDVPNVLKAMMKLEEVVVMYLNDDQISRPPAPPIFSSCKGIMSCFSFMFLCVPRQYVRRSYRLVYHGEREEIPKIRPSRAHHTN